MFKKTLLIATLVATIISPVCVAQQPANPALARIMPTGNVIKDSYKMGAIGLAQMIPDLAKNLPEYNEKEALSQIEAMYIMTMVWQKNTMGAAIVAYYDVAKDTATSAMIQDIVDNSEDVSFITIDKTKASSIIKNVFDVSDKVLFITYKDGKEVARTTTLDKKELTKREPIPANIKTLEQLLKEDTKLKDKATLQEQAPDLAKVAKEGNELDAALFGYIAQEEKPVMVKFSASWCPPCRTMKPIVREVAQEYLDDIVIVEVTLDQSTQHILQAFGAQGIPTFVFFKDGKKVDLVSGALPKEALAGKIKKLI